MSTQSEIEKLVNKVAKDALAPDVEHHARVEALKVLTPYYLSLKKDKNPDDSNDSTMADFAAAMQEPVNAQVRGNRRQRAQ